MIFVWVLVDFVKWGDWVVIVCGFWLMVGLCWRSDILICCWLGNGVDGDSGISIGVMVMIIV